MSLTKEQSSEVLEFFRYEGGNKKIIQDICSKSESDFQGCLTYNQFILLFREMVNTVRGYRNLDNVFSPIYPDAYIHSCLSDSKNPVVQNILLISKDSYDGSLTLGQAKWLSAIISVRKIGKMTPNIGDLPVEYFNGLAVDNWSKKLIHECLKKVYMREPHLFSLYKGVDYPFLFNHLMVNKSSNKQ